jgi:predicted nucleotidyltransferase
MGNKRVAALLTPHTYEIGNRVLEEESAHRKHLVVSLSGAHAYGFPSPDSDLDLKAIHIEATRKIVGMTPPPLHVDRMEIIEGVEIDYTSNELQPVLKGILLGNGNYIERVLGELLPVAAPELESLKPIVERSLSRNVYRHYHGFASGQRKDFVEAPAATAKKVLYVLRTALTGTHLLRTGKLVVDVTLLLDEYQLGHARDLIAQKQSGERITLSEKDKAFWTAEVERAFASLEKAHTESPLPELPPNPGEFDAWLEAQRRAHW